MRAQKAEKDELIIATKNEFLGMKKTHRTKEDEKEGNLIIYLCGDAEKDIFQRRLYEEMEELKEEIDTLKKTAHEAANVNIEKTLFTSGDYAWETDF